MDNRRKLRIAAITMLLLGVFGAAMTITPQRKTQALPIFARRYQVPCSTCHLMPPLLNKTGLAFQANHFNWPNGKPAHFRDNIGADPISVLVTNFSTSGQGVESLTEFSAAELFASDGIRIRPGFNGGYWIDYAAVTNGTRAGGLDGAWAAMPLGGNRGQLQLAAGQFDPLMYQCDSIGDLPQTQPAIFNNGINNVAFDSSSPGVRLEYFNNRSKLTPNGDYVEVGVPFAGHLNLNEYSSWYGDQGVYVHAFKRQGYSTEGFLYYGQGNSNFGSLIATRHVGKYLYFMGAAGTGHDATGDENYLTGEVNYVPCSWLALTGRYDSVKGTVNQNIPVADITLYPGKNIRWVRLQGETVQQKGARSNTVYLFIQL